MKEDHGYVQRTFRLKAETVKRLDEYSRKTGVTRTFAVEKAILDYLGASGAASVTVTGQKGGAT